ncbi:MAG: putative ABC-type ATPase [Saprospiraceae bacterium]
MQVRVQEGGHNIPEKVIRRRYQNGLSNFFKLYRPIVTDWMFINNSGDFYEILAQGTEFEDEVLNDEIWSALKAKYDE